MTATAGLYARAVLPNLQEPMMAYPMLAENVLPPIAKGMFYVGMLATIMSTLNTLAFVSAQTLGRDIFGRLRIGEQTKSEIKTFYTKIGLIISFLLSVAIALIIPSVIQLWYNIGTVVIPGLLVPLMASYFERFRITSRYAFLAMLFGWLTSLGWLISGYFTGNTANYPLGIEPMYPGLIISIFIWGLGRVLSRRKLDATDGT